MKLKIMEYNLLEGLSKHNDKKDIYEFDKKRMKLVLTAVKKFNQDILILCEASFTPSHEKSKERFGIIIDYARLFGYPYFCYGIRTDRDGSTILSRYPLKFEEYSMEKTSFVRCFIKIKNKKITLDVVHPHPRISAFDKMRFIKSVIRDKEKNYILAGDFNSPSPEDRYNREKLVQAFRGMLKPWEGSAEKYVEKMLQGEMIEFIINSGLIDTYRATNKKKDFVFTNPTKLVAGVENSAMRLDYIFCSKEFKVLDAGIIKNKITDFASDHYPIYAVLEIK